MGKLQPLKFLILQTDQDVKQEKHTSSSSQSLYWTMPAITTSAPFI